MKNLSCQCRISPDILLLKSELFIKWKIYLFHLICYTLIPAIILIASNTGLFIYN